jgi:iron complex transport system substrate-binding protein
MQEQIVFDHLKRIVNVPKIPQRIISLCPSITETLYALGLGERIVGRTHFCIHPQNSVKKAAVVGGTKQVKEEIIVKLDPDLIIAEKEENPKEMVERLAEKYPVFVANVETYEETLQMIRDLGKITQQGDTADAIVQQIESQFAALARTSSAKAAYVVWKEPYMVAGNHTFIHALLEKCGFVNVFKDYPGRYPMITREDFEKEAPDYIFLSSEPYPFNASHKEEFRMGCSLPVLVDGEAFGWYGARTAQFPSYFHLLLQELNGLKTT